VRRPRLIEWEDQPWLPGALRDEATAEGPDYAWEVGRVRAGAAPWQGTYLLGWPREAARRAG